METNDKGLYNPSDKELYQAIMNHPILHDCFTHLSDFQNAVTYRRNTSLSKVDADYWQKQLDTTYNIASFCYKNYK